MCENDSSLNVTYSFNMQLIIYKSGTEHPIIPSLLYLCEISIINCICEPRIESEANNEIFSGYLPCTDPQAKIMRKQWHIRTMSTS